MKELRQQVMAIVHAQGQASVEVASRRVKRAEQGSLVAPQQIAALPDSASDVDRFETPLRRKVQSQFGWTRCHLELSRLYPILTGLVW